MHIYYYFMDEGRIKSTTYTVSQNVTLFPGL